VQVPIIAPIKQKKVEVEDKEAPPSKYSPAFLASLLSTPDLCRNVAVVGHLHHGKTLVRRPRSQGGEGRGWSGTWNTGMELGRRHCGRSRRLRRSPAMPPLNTLHSFIRLIDWLPPTLFRQQFMDMLVEQTHDLRGSQRSNERPLRFTDTRVDEQARAISLKSVPLSLVLEGASGKSYGLSLMDTPGAAAGRRTAPLRC
jgi:hypothetical protein